MPLKKKTAKTKIESNFTDPEVAELYQLLKDLPEGKRTGRFVQEWADKKRGFYVSEQSGINTVKGPFQDYLDQLAAKADMARNIAEVAKHGLSLTDAAAVKLAVRINDDLDRAGDLTIEDKGNYSLAISRLRTGDQRARYLEHTIARQQFDAAKAVIEHAPKLREIMSDKKLDGPARTERVRKLLFGEMPADFKPVATKGAQDE